jgi:hypothetical protein
MRTRRTFALRWAAVALAGVAGSFLALSSNIVAMAATDDAPLDRTFAHNGRVATLVHFAASERFASPRFRSRHRPCAALRKAAP